MKQYLGIRLKNQEVAFVLGNRQGIETFAVERIPVGIIEPNRSISWEQLAAFVKDKLREHKISCHNGALVIPENIVYTRRFLMPYMTEEQLQFNLPYEFRDFIMEDKDAYFYDYALLDVLEEEDTQGAPRKTLDLMGAAVAKESMLKFKRMFQKAGLKLKVAAPEAAAYQNIVYRLKEQEGHDNYVLLDLENEAVVLRIFIEGKYETGRELGVGMDALTEVIAVEEGVDERTALMYRNTDYQGILSSDACIQVYQQISREIMQVMNFYMYNYPNHSLDKVYCCGSGAAIRPLMGYLSDVLDADVRGLYELFEGYPKEALLYGAAAVGMIWNQEER